MKHTIKKLLEPKPHEATENYLGRLRKRLKKCKRMIAGYDEESRALQQHIAYAEKARAIENRAPQDQAQPGKEKES